MRLFSDFGGERGTGTALCSAERRCQDLPSTKQANPETAGRGDQGERKGEEPEKG